MIKAVDTILPFGDIELHFMSLNKGVTSITHTYVIIYFIQIFDFKLNYN